MRIARVYTGDWTLILTVLRISFTWSHCVILRDLLSAHPNLSYYMSGHHGQMVIHCQGQNVKATLD